MIAEEYIEATNQSDISDNKGKTLSLILSSLQKSIIPFKKACKQENLVLPLNENKLTNIFVEQVEVHVKPLPTIGVKNQYSDLFFGTKGIPDFYFHKVEEGVVHEPLFVVESKIIPAPKPLTREKEYVIGNNNNGGIERFKSEKHGKGLDECGMIGFMEKENFEYWLDKINSWIMELSETEATWSNDELLNSEANQAEYCYLKSAAYTFTRNRMKLHHFWIDISAPMYSTQN